MIVLNIKVGAVQLVHHSFLIRSAIIVCYVSSLHENALIEPPKKLYNMPASCQALSTKSVHTSINMQ